MTDAGLEHVLLALIAAIPAIIAAISSLSNGREQKRVRKELAEVNGKIEHTRKKKSTLNDQTVISDPDWYKAPELN
jgi:cell division protein FtsL